MDIKEANFIFLVSMRTTAQWPLRWASKLKCPTNLYRRSTERKHQRHQDLLANPLPVKSGEVDLLLGALWGRRSRTPCEEALSYPSSLASHHSTHFSLLPGKPHPLSITGFCTLGLFSCFDLLSSRKVVMSLHTSDDMCRRAGERYAEAPLLTRL